MGGLCNYKDFEQEMDKVNRDPYAFPDSDNPIPDESDAVQSDEEKRNIPVVKHSQSKSSYLSAIGDQLIRFTPHKDAVPPKSKRRSRHVRPSSVVDGCCEECLVRLVTISHALDLLTRRTASSNYGLET